MEKVQSASTHLSYIQGLRAIAVISVIAFHAGLPVPGGYAGVDVFFVISGFVITGALSREFSRNSTVDLKSFYLRRFKRLTPALALTVSFTLILGAFILSPIGQQAITAKTAIGSILLSSNFVIAKTTGGYFDNPAESNPLLNTWSLSVEEQFYLIFPLLLFIAWKIGTKFLNKALISFVIVCVISALSLLLSFYAVLNAESYPTLLGFYSPIPRVWEFGVGSLLSLLGNRLILKKPVAKMSSLVGITLIIATFWLIDNTTIWPSAWTLIPVIGTAFVIVAGSNSSILVMRILGARALTGVGDRSYSLYLWHWPVIVFTGLILPEVFFPKLIGALISIPIAMLAYKTLEEPLRKLRFSSLPRKVWVGIMGSVILIPLLLGISLLISTNNYWGNQKLQNFSKQTDELWTGWESCRWKIPNEEGAQNCKWNSEFESMPVYLVGDSNAGHFSDGFIQATKDLGLPFELLVANRCPLLIGINNSSFDPGCQKFNSEERLPFLEKAQTGLVVLSNWDVYWFEGKTSYLEVSAGSLSKTVELAQQSLEKTIQKIRADGHKVLYISTVPNWTEVEWGNPDVPTLWSPQSCNLLNLITRDCNQIASVKQLDSSKDILKKALTHTATIAGASVWNPTHEICPNEYCQISDLHGTRIFKDSNHISVDESNKLSPSIKKNIYNSIIKEKP